ncbi:MAG: aldehyde dehydrogenase family protein [Pseudomonadota bacterium]|nr:aldehyde dehydrogenase family protein [Pseudomonadota bacterium]
MSENDTKFYIDGAWLSPNTPKLHTVVNPATEEAAGQISLGSGVDVDKAVAAARRAFLSYSQTSVKERIALLERIAQSYETRKEDLARAMTLEMGTPISFSRTVQNVLGVGHFKQMAKTLETYEFDEVVNDTLIRREGIGVCGLITPWNWPINQVTTKLAAALGAGCSVVLKPSELAPLSVIILAEILHAAGVPEGVFNLVNGDGPTVGEAISSHPDIDMVSFTGSTRAGILIAKSAADTVKRVTQELGGKSANIVLPDADLSHAVPDGLIFAFKNAGQSCIAPSRMLVHRSQLNEAKEFARQAAAKLKVGDPMDPSVAMGPLANQAQFEKVRRMIEIGIREGATLICGGIERPAGVHRGYFVRPTVFADVTPDMTIAREEIFGPVLSILTYDTEEEAIDIANETVYGLAAYVQSTDLAHAQRVGAQLRAGRVYLGAHRFPILDVPFGGYKRSGNGREMGRWGLEEYLETKALIGYVRDPARLPPPCW